MAFDHQIYVSTKGSNTNSGSELSPFLTLKRAIEEVVLLRQTQQGSIEVLVLGGTYYLSETLIIPEEASGTEADPVSFSAYANDKVTLSGGLLVNAEWYHFERGIWMCHLDLDCEDFSQVFVNGRRQTRARYPEKSVDNYLYPLKASEWPVKQLHIDPNTFTDKIWEKPEEGIVHIFGATEWGNLQWELNGIDKEAGFIELGKGGYQINDIMQGVEATGIDQRSGYYVENIFEELDSPSEWYYDKSEGILYVMPEAGIDLNIAQVEVSHIEELIEIKGSQDKPVHHITVSGLNLTGTETTFLSTYEAPSLGDWTIHRGGLIKLEGTEQCTLKDCVISGIGGNGVFVNLYNRDITIRHNKIYDVGESGICIVGNKQMAIGSNECYPKDIVVHNNSIHDVGVFGKQTAGVFMSITCDNTISHNHIYNLPRAAICINDGTWGGHIIEYNDVHDTVKETCDHGCFNSWGRDRYWCLQQSHGPASHEAGNVKLDARKPVIIRHNRFADQSGWGIDLDDGSSNFHIYNNLCIGISIKLREGDYRLVENNIFVNPANPPGIHIGYENNHDQFTRNIIVTSELTDNPEVDIDFVKDKADGSSFEFIGPPPNGKFLELCDNNLFYNSLGYFTATVYYRPLKERIKHTYDLEQWQELGMDMNSLYADPQFVDLEAGDYNLKQSSPAFGLGFKAFDMTKFGIV